jgi:hypothetical protein
VKAALMEDRLGVVLSADSSCSVFWLLAEDGGAELAAVLGTVTERTGLVPWGFAGRWEGSSAFEPRWAELQHASRLRGEFSIGRVRLEACAAQGAVLDGEWFWAAFGGALHPHQVCAALMPPAAGASGGWVHAGLELVLAAAAVQARPGPSHRQVLPVLAQAFIAETLLAGGAAVTRVTPELLWPGIALTLASPLAGQLADTLATTPPIDPLKLERSRHLSGSW